jgi:hypothetical protein
MKRRKPPVVLITCLVLMLVAVGIMYAPRGSTPEGQQEPPPQQAENGDRPKISSTDVASIASHTMQSAKPGPKQMGGPPGSGPSISVRKPENTAPKPNDSSTSTQWYTNETKK